MKIETISLSHSYQLSLASLLDFNYGKCQNFLYLSHSFETLFFLLSYKQMTKSITDPYWDVTFSWYLGRFTCTVREALNYHNNKTVYDSVISIIKLWWVTGIGLILWFMHGPPKKCVRPHYNNKAVRKMKAHILGQLKATTNVMSQNSREELA